MILQRVVKKETAADRYRRFMKTGSFKEEVQPTAEEEKILFFTEAPGDDDDPDPNIAAEDDDPDPNVGEEEADPDPNVAADDGGDDAPAEDAGGDEGGGDDPDPNVEAGDDAGGDDPGGDEGGGDDEAITDGAADADTDDGGDDDLDPNVGGGDDDAGGDDTGGDTGGDDAGGGGDGEKKDGAGTDFDSTRTYQLYKEYLSLYTLLKNYAETLSGLYYDDTDSNLLVKRVSKQVDKLMTIMYDYLVMRYQASSYPENMLFYKQMVSAVYMCFNLLEQRRSKDSKS